MIPNMTTFSRLLRDVDSLSSHKQSTRGPKLWCWVMSSDPSRLDYFDYDLPDSYIAQTPIEPRDAARMLVDLAGTDADPTDSTVGTLAKHLQPGDIVVVNNTRVLAARLLLKKETGGNAEVFLLEPTGVANQWTAMVRPGKRIQPGTTLLFEQTPMVQVGERRDDGLRTVTLLDDTAIEKAGNVPLPPYITETLDDEDRYQTMFAERLGSVAAPTAGLHFTPEVCQSLKDRGIELVSVELRVGLATFRPISADVIVDHEMHTETYHIEPQTWDRVQQTKRDGGRVVAVGTTVVRALESASQSGELTAETSLFINRSFHWKTVDVLLTNFHMPKSSLLVLLDSFMPGRWKELYEYAKNAGYRFLSFGDCMLVERRSGRE